MGGGCSKCRQPAPGYDRLPERWWRFIPLWGIVSWFLYAPRRVECAVHGVVVEYLPWSDGKRPITLAMMGFLARWARHLSWRQTARAFHTSWEAVYRSVEWFVQWGLAHRQLQGVRSIGVDEIHWGKGKRIAERPAYSEYPSSLLKPILPSDSTGLRRFRCAFWQRPHRACRAPAVPSWHPLWRRAAESVPQPRIR
jgi:transposase